MLVESGGTASAGRTRGQVRGSATGLNRALTREGRGRARCALSRPVYRRRRGASSRGSRERKAFAAEAGRRNRRDRTRPETLQSVQGHGRSTGVEPVEGRSPAAALWRSSIPVSLPVSGEMRMLLELRSLWISRDSGGHSGKEECPSNLSSFRRERMETSPAHSNQSMSSIRTLFPLRSLTGRPARAARQDGISPNPRVVDPAPTPECPSLVDPTHTLAKICERRRLVVRRLRFGQPRPKVHALHHFLYNTGPSQKAVVFPAGESAKNRRGRSTRSLKGGYGEIAAQ